MVSSAPPNFAKASTALPAETAMPATLVRSVAPANMEPLDEA